MFENRIPAVTERVDAQPSVVKGQKVTTPLRERARALRQTMTEAERVLWANLRDHRLYNAHFRRQQIIGGFIVDFYCSAARLVVEVDGPIHENQVEADQDREAILRRHGLEVFRCTNDQVLYDLPTVRSRIAELVSLSATRIDAHGQPR
jgi:very-short-patch-repair endonuclease